MLDKVKVILWDFDGVLMQSNEVRDIGFEKILEEFPKDQVDELMVFHKRNGGLSRYVKFRYFFEEILKQTISDEKVNELAASFSKIMKELLVDPSLLIQDSLEFVRQNHSNISMHIVSGSDQVELRYLCEAMNINKYFKSIHGSPTPKKQLVKEVIESNSYSKNQMVLIGDSINDYEAAVENGIQFIGYNNTMFEESDVFYIKSFSMLESKFL
jgi:phosphoglycolate phosphatase-like HAD superfamily hydrolase